VGLYGPAEWVDLPKNAVFPPTVLPPPGAQLAPVPVADDFETTAVGQLPGRATVFEEGLGDSIRVVEGGAASGRRSLLFLDAPGMKYSFNPHLYYNPHFGDGVARLAFDLRLEKGAIAAHEWRDSRQPYRVGPSLFFRDGKVLAHGKPVAEVPWGQWFRVEIACGLGRAASGSYELKLLVPGGARQSFKLPCVEAKFNRLEWLGFTSLATEKTEFRLDNVKLELAGHQAPPAVRPSPASGPAQ